MWLAAEPLILASRSAARRQLLESAGLPVEMHPADIDERAMEQAALPASAERIALTLARAKADAVARGFPRRIVVAADQTLACEGRLYAKPADLPSAREQLNSLDGRTHELHSAVAVMHGQRLAFEHVGTAQMTMRQLSDAFLDVYLGKVGPAVQTSVGGYQLEGLGAHLFEDIRGDYFTILGLPLVPLLAFFRRERLVPA
jgi:septum formation protein